MWLYQCLDAAVSATECLGLVAVAAVFLKEPRFLKGTCLFVLGAVVMLATVFFTWFTELGGLKQFFILPMTALVLKGLYRDRLRSAVLVVELWYVFPLILPETVLLGAVQGLTGGNMTTVVEGQEMVFPWLYGALIAARLLLTAFLYRLFRNFCYEISRRDFLLITVNFLLVFAPFFLTTYGFLNLQITEVYSFCWIIILLVGVFSIALFYIRNTIFLREKKQEDEWKLEQMRRQYAYYQEKQKDEERIRSIYHDMKNHLLVLEGCEQNEALGKMAGKLREEIAAYEDYVHTGNDFLDVILRDKAAKARQRHIDFSIGIEPGSVDFLKPLDLSTIFGNGLDNAIEASEKLPEEQRVILVKAGRRGDFLSILIENRCREEQGKERTTKGDPFLHGFGIPNMQKAAEKYQGTCTAVGEGGRFALKFLLPVSERKEGD